MIVTVVIFYFLYENVISKGLLKMLLTMKTVVINNQSYGFGKKKLMNQKSGTIRKFLVKMATLSQLGKNKQELDIFYVILDYIFWENIVTERNRYANQIMNNKNKRVKIDET